VYQMFRYIRMIQEPAEHDDNVSVSNRVISLQSL
jgi:hypothetical protein